MKKNIYFKLSYLNIVLIISFFNFCIINETFAWGFFAHKKINRYAIFSLPKEMFKFYKYYIDYLEENAVNPDKRRYVVEGEACKHFIDIESYNDKIKNLPRYWNQAIQKYSKEFLIEHGTLPWTIQNEKEKLIRAFIEKDITKILKLSADIGHYIADANVPLHTSKNYDGQLTDQKGIHGFWESRLPELFFDNYNLLVGKAEYIKDTRKVIWQAIYDSHSLVKILLEEDRKLTSVFPSIRKYSFEEKNGIMKKVISVEYCKKYDELIKGQIETQMRKSIKMVSDFWMTCWIEAGKPYLDDLINIKFEEIKEDIDDIQLTNKIREHE